MISFKKEVVCYSSSCYIQSYFSIFQGEISWPEHWTRWNIMIWSFALKTPLENSKAYHFEYFDCQVGQRLTASFKNCPVGCTYAPQWCKDFGVSDGCWAWWWSNSTMFPVLETTNAMLCRKPLEKRNTNPLDMLFYFKNKGQVFYWWRYVVLRASVTG